MRRLVIVGLQALLLLGFTACGGGGGGGFIAGKNYPAYSKYAAQCAVPRSGTNSSGHAYPDRPGTVTTENRWLRSWTNELYLWYDEVEDVDPASVPSTSQYFRLMKTMAKLPSGQDKDRFHFTYPTDLWEQLSQQGISVGYGISWKDDVEQQVFVQFVEPGSAAEAAGIRRGDEVLSVDGVDVHAAMTATAINSIFAGLYPDVANEMHDFVFAGRNGGPEYSRTLTATNFLSNPVPMTDVFDTLSGKVGYLLFNSHDLPAESELVDAVNAFKANSISDLVIDLRYNGGGYLFIASQLAYMIAGPASTSGKDFERIVFNDKHPNADPVTGSPLRPFPFLATTSGLGSLPADQALPTLNLSRVYVLTSGGTCSASESVINGLRGAGVTVYQIGADTCGKPYGFYPADNCGTTYFSIQFQGVNEVGFGDYLEGFSASRDDIAAGARLPGCTVDDDLGTDLGNAGEGQLNAALTLRTSGSCPGIPPSKPRLPSPGRQLPDDLREMWTRPPQPWRENRFVNRP